MGGVFYNLGRMAGPILRKGKWALQSLIGSEADVIQAEYEVGRDMAQALSEEIELDTDAATSNLVAQVGARLAGRLTNRKRRFEFRVILGDEVNAFALPGGFIYVTRLLLALCETNVDEVAFVLGHEMAHVVRGHAMERIMNRAVVTLASKTHLAAGVFRHRLVELGLRLLHQAYSQDQELEADEFGTRLAASAGFDPAGAVRTLERLKSRGGGHGESELAGYFSSHPPTELRITELKRRLRQRKL